MNYVKLCYANATRQSRVDIREMSFNVCYRQDALTNVSRVLQYIRINGLTMSQQFCYYHLENACMSNVFAWTTSIIDLPISSSFSFLYSH
jgi:hypothetical protein